MKRREEWLGVAGGVACRGPLAVALGAVGAAVDELSWQVAFTASPNELVDAVGEIVAVKNRFDQMLTSFVFQMERCGAPASVGLRTVGQVLGAKTAADPRAFRAAGVRGRWLQDFAEFEAAAESGAMGAAHLDLIRRRLDGPRTHFVLRDDQQLFVDAARDCSFADFGKVVDYWLIAVDPDGDEPKDQAARTGLSMRIGRGGRVHLQGDFDALSGQALRTAVDRVAQQLRLADEDTGTIRSEANRRAEALVELVIRGAARADGTHPVPLINIVMSETVAEHLIEQLANDGLTSGPISEPDRMPVAWNDIDGRCELIDGTPIHPHHALKLFGVATFRRHIIGASGRAIDVSVNARTFPAWMRNTLHVQARGRCETPGCDAPHHWIQADHIQPHSRNGKTRLANGQNQCAADNKAKTNTTGHTPWHTKRTNHSHDQRARVGETDDDH